MDYLKAAILGFAAGAIVAIVVATLSGCAAQQQCYAIQGVVDGSNVAVLFNNCTGKFTLAPIPGMKVDPDPVSSTPKREPSRQPGV